MDKFKKKIQQKLVAEIIKEKLKQSGHLVFREAWCTQERVLRFTTPFFRELFPILNESGGKWKTGDSVMFEVNNGIDAFVVDCVLCPASPSPERTALAARLIKAAGAKASPGSPETVLKSWDLTRADGDNNKLFEDFDRLIQKTIPYFERELKEKLEAPEELTEGAAESVTSSKYERNPEARAACLAYHGTACKVCGFDFGKAYGPEFAGKIEVHHIVPLSEIGEEYVVDPIRDLVPVCPNCHTALHSKKNGVYTVEELKAKRQSGR